MSQSADQHNHIALDFGIHTFDSRARAVAAAATRVAMESEEFSGGTRMTVPCTISIGLFPPAGAPLATFTETVGGTIGLCLDVLGTSYCVGVYSVPHHAAEGPRPTDPEVLPA